MIDRDSRARRHLPLRPMACVIFCGVAALASTGCSPYAASLGEGSLEPAAVPLLQVVESTTDFPHRIAAGRVSLGYPEGLWVIKEESGPSVSNVLGKEATSTTALVGDDDFSHGFTVGECVGLSLDDMLEYAETAQGQAPARAAVLEEKARESEQSAQIFSGLAKHFRTIVYSDPERIVLNGRRGAIWGMAMPYESGAFVTRIYLAEVDANAIGFALCGYYQPEYDADPAFWDAIFASLEVD